MVFLRKNRPDPVEPLLRLPIHMRVASRSHQTINLGLGLRLNHAHVASTTPHSCVGPSEIDRSSLLSDRFSFVSFMRAPICFDLLFELRVELIYCLSFGLPL